MKGLLCKTRLWNQTVWIKLRRSHSANCINANAVVNIMSFKKRNTMLLAKRMPNTNRKIILQRLARAATRVILRVTWNSNQLDVKHEHESSDGESSVEWITAVIGKNKHNNVKCFTNIKEESVLFPDIMLPVGVPWLVRPYMYLWFGVYHFLYIKVNRIASVYALRWPLCVSFCFLFPSITKRAYVFTLPYSLVSLAQRAHIL